MDWLLTTISAVAKNIGSRLLSTGSRSSIDELIIVVSKSAIYENDIIYRMRELVNFGRSYFDFATHLDDVGQDDVFVENHDVGVLAVAE